MTCHEEYKETAALHVDGAGGIEGLVTLLAVERHNNLRVSKKSHVLSHEIWSERHI